MNLVKYKNGLNKLGKAFTPISQHYGKPKIYFWVDAFISYIRYGVTPNQYIAFHFYEKSNLEKKEFYTHRQHLRFEALLNNPQYYDTFWNKAKFNIAFKDFIDRDWLFCENASENQVKQFLVSHEKIMVKPTSASSGKGIHVYKGEDSINTLIETKALLEEFVVQHHEMSKLNPSSVNTIRIYTIIDKNKKPHILSASIRVGGENSEVDNYHAGGVRYPLDIEHGIVMLPGKTITGNLCIFHPNTKVKMIGFEVPNWDELKAFVFRATKVCPTARMIAWDVAVLENGFEMIEGNYNGDPGLMQAPSNVGKKREIQKYM